MVFGLIAKGGDRKGAWMVRAACVTALVLAGVVLTLPARAGDGRALTPELLSNYVAQRGAAAFRTSSYAASAALDAATAFAGAPVPVLNQQMLTRYVTNDFLSTSERVTLAAGERQCLAQALYHEARGEPEAGQWAVAQVILNRVNSPRYPSSICGVVFQNAARVNKCQFSFACDGRPDTGGIGNRIIRQAWVKANLIAMAAYRQFQAGRDPTEVPASTLFYHASSVSPGWARAMDPVAEIGGHVFYSAL